MSEDEKQKWIDYYKNHVIEQNKRINEAIEYIENYCIGNLQYENKTHKVLLNILKGDKE